MYKKRRDRRPHAARAGVRSVVVGEERQDENGKASEDDAAGVYCSPRRADSPARRRSSSLERQPRLRRSREQVSSAYRKTFDRLSVVIYEALSRVRSAVGRAGW